MIPWWAAGLVSNLAIGIVEAINRRSPDAGFLGVLPYTIVFIALAQWGLWRAYSGAPSLMAGWAAFTLGNTVVRLAVTNRLVGEVLGWESFIGVALITAGAAVIQYGR